EKSTKQLALIQIQAIPQQLPFFVILVELAHMECLLTSTF
ncbi:unnamed protein product, partial [Rotaria sordida]